MDPVSIALFVTVIPAATAAAVLLLTHFATRGRKDTAADLGPALGAGFVAGFLGVAGLPKFPPVEAWQWLLTFAVAGVALGVVELRAPTWLRWTLRGALLLFAVWATYLDRSVVGVAVLGAAALAFAWMLARLAARTSVQSFLVTSLVVATATSVSLVISNTMLVGQLCGSLAAGLGAGIVLGWRIPVVVRRAVPVMAVLLVALWMNGALFADLPIASAALLAVVPAAVWLVDVVVGPRLAPPRLFLVRTAAAIVVAGAAVAVAVACSPPLEY